MMNSRLMKLVPGSMRYIIHTVLYQWIGLLFNILTIFTFAHLIQGLFTSTLTTKGLTIGFILIATSIAVRFITQILSARTSYHASSQVKNELRERIYNKLLDLGLGYNEVISTSKVVQISSEGVEQIEIYFSRYLPQLFYSLLAPITLFVILSFVHFKIAFILLICVPLIPMSIIAVNKFAKKLFSKYWAFYTGLGNHFLDNLQGLTTLKVYQDDAHCNEQMNVDAEHFRKITMKVLTMQLNSITLMDLIAFGGAALGIICALITFNKGNITLQETIVFLLLTSEFFIPLRLLGSYFHVAMNGMSAANQIFALLDANVPESQTCDSFKNGEIRFKDVYFSYDSSRQVLKNINLIIPQSSFVSIVGESGCGKSTIVSLLMGFSKNYQGHITIGDTPLEAIDRTSFMNHVCMIKHQNYLFKGTVREQLLMARPEATTQEMLHVLKQVNLYDFIMANGGLDMMLLEDASNLSGGQAQRLALARALMYDACIYIFDEATSNIDVESETIIYDIMRQLAKTKTVILISHRLANVIASDIIYVLDQGQLVETGIHKALLQADGHYAKLFRRQRDLEAIYEGGKIHHA